MSNSDEIISLYEKYGFELEELLTQTCYYWTGELQALAYSSYSDVSHPKSQ